MFLLNTFDDRFLWIAHLAHNGVNQQFSGSICRSRCSSEVGDCERRLEFGWSVVVECRGTVCCHYFYYFYKHQENPQGRWALDQLGNSFVYRIEPVSSKRSF